MHLAPDNNHASTPPLSFLQAGCPSCRPTNSVKALKASNFFHKMAKNFGSEIWYASYLTSFCGPLAPPFRLKI